MKKPSEKRTFAQRVNEDAKDRTSALAVQAAADAGIARGVATSQSQLGVRIEQLVELFDTQKEAAEIAGVAPKTLQNWISGATMPGFELLAQLAAKKNVNLEWLASGRGAMIAGEIVPAGVVSDFSYIPRYSVRAGAGSGQIVESENLLGFLAFRTEWIRTRLRRNPSKLVVLEAYGDSMEKTISDGDILLVDISEERVRGPAIYVILAGNEAIVKRIELTLEGWLIVKSDNPAYETRTLKGEQAEDFRCLGKVVWAGGMI